MMYPLVAELAADGVPVAVSCRVVKLARQPYRHLTVQQTQALTRFIYAHVAAMPRDGDATSIWLAIADSPTPMLKVIEANKAAIDADPHRFLQLLSRLALSLRGRP